MINKKYRKNFSNIFFGVLVISIFSACVGNQKLTSGEIPNLTNNQGNTMSLQKTDDTSTPTDNQKNIVSLRLINISSEKVILEFSNKTNKAIYLSYEPSKNEDANSKVFYYWFRCKGKGEKEIDYNRLTSHIIPGFEPLEKDTGFRFEVSPLPKINASCKVSVLYYDDKRIVDLIDNFPSGISESDHKLIEKAKKSAELQFELNNEQSDEIP